MKFTSTLRGWGALFLALGLTACASKPEPAAWQMESQSASDRAVAAYLKGQSRVAQVEWSKAFSEVSATGMPSAMARMALLQCAAQTAALEFTDCPRYQQYAAGAAPAEQSYARYLQGRVNAQDVPLLPEAQQAMAAQILQGAGGVQQLPPGVAALSQLTAAGVALRAGQLNAGAVQQASQIAAEQGWRRAAMAWLLVEKRLADQAGDVAAAQALALRLQVLQENAAGAVKEK